MTADHVATGFMLLGVVIAFLFGLFVGRPSIFPAMIVGGICGFIGDTIVFEGMGGGAATQPFLCLIVVLIGVAVRASRRSGGAPNTGRKHSGNQVTLPPDQLLPPPASKQELS